MNGGRFRGEDGFSILEAVVAMMVTVVGFTAATLVLVRAVDGSADAAARNQAAVIGFDVLEAAKAYGCGLQVIDEPFFDDLTAACGFDLGSGTGSLTFDREIGATTYTTGFDVMWLPSTGGYTCAALAGTEPSHLVRTVTVTWERATTKSEEAAAVEAVPGDAARYRSSARQHLVVQPPGLNPGDRVTLTASTGGPDPILGRSITRTADASGCAWFPWLPFPGAPSAPAGLSYQYQINGGASHPVTSTWWSGPLEAR